MFGKLTWQAIPFDQPIPLMTGGRGHRHSRRHVVWVALKGYIPYLWKEWITSVDHKRIGIMYCLLALVMLLRGFSDALMMRSQQALPSMPRAICRRSITTRSSRPTAPS